MLARQDAGSVAMAADTTTLDRRASSKSRKSASRKKNGPPTAAAVAAHESRLVKLFEILGSGATRLMEMLDAARSTPPLQYRQSIAAFREALGLATQLHAELVNLGYDESNADDLCKMIVEVSNAPDDGESAPDSEEQVDPEEVAARIALVLEGPRVSAGLLALIEADAACAEGRWRNAANFYQDAEANLTGLPDVELEISLARTLSRWAMGLHYAQNGSRTDALRELESAVAKARYELTPAIEALGNSDGAALLRSHVDGVECAAIGARAIQHFSAGRYADAEDRYRELCSRHETAITAIRGYPVPSMQRDLMLRGREAELAIAKAYLALSAGELAREARNWAEATKMYGLARTAFSGSSEALAAIDTPAATDAQAAALNQVLVEIAERRCESDRDLWEQVEAARTDARRAEERATAEAESSRRALDALGKLGITVNVSNRAEANAAAEATATLNQAIHQQIFEDLDNLKAAIGTSQLPANERAKLEGEIDALKADGEKEGSEGFLRRIKKFVEDSGSVIETIDKASGPLAKVARWVLPMAPIAGRALGLM
jgi:hypothetical protein